MDVAIDALARRTTKGGSGAEAFQIGRDALRPFAGSPRRKLLRTFGIKRTAFRLEQDRASLHGKHGVPLRRGDLNSEGYVAADAKGDDVDYYPDLVE